ncbi:unnamed protein product [Knipowitschia caucasica]|uniref:Pro-opiomelanocortin/corticotropin ACTH central region domain-containing protein n=2 Tax=Knipowitschia caucasica TaxID=637954 RepID=A0AAV2KE36_KNICA
MWSSSWFFVAVMAHVCHCSRVSECWHSSICSNLSNKQHVLACIQLCVSEMQNESPHSMPVQDTDPEQNELTSDIRPDSHDRRSYSMEHFRWGKPPGRKRRPVKVFSSFAEVGGSSEGAGPIHLQRRQLMAYDKRNKDMQRKLRSKASSHNQAQERKDGTYRMSHFRWGSPPANKRNGNSLQPWQETPQNPLSKLLRNLMGKNVKMAG